MKAYCSNCNKSFDETEWAKLKFVGFNGCNCFKCVKERVLKQYKQLKKFEERS